MQRKMIKKFNKKAASGIIKGLEKNLFNKMDAVALRAHSRLVEITPVDLGQARAGWNFTLNEIDYSFPPKPPKGTTLPAPSTKLPSPKAKKFGDSYYISNFVAHIVFLNEGVALQSKGVPANFIEREILAAIEEVRRAG